MVTVHCVSRQGGYLGFMELQLLYGCRCLLFRTRGSEAA
mgnify:CR=1 FL=1